MNQLMIAVGNVDAYCQATDSEIMAAAAKIVDKRMGGAMSPFVSTALHELAVGFFWCDANGYPDAAIHVQFDGYWKTP